MSTKRTTAKKMSTFKSLLNTAREKLSGSSTPTQATSLDGLFPKVDPSTDGEDCDHDCESCGVSYPRGFKIDEDDKLYGHIKGWSQHILVATGKTDWVRDVADEKGSLMEAIEKATVKPSQGVRTRPSESSSQLGSFTNRPYRNSCSQPRISLRHHTPQTTQSQQPFSSCRHS